jgi:hypothetical protein
MTFTPATAEAVAAAREAVASAERIRTHECERRGPNCRTRETEEQAKRDTLASVLANKASTDRAAALDTEASALRRRLDSGQVAKKANPLGEALGTMLSLPAAQASTLQQQAMSGVVELLIAFAAALPELLRKRPVETKRQERDPEPAVEALAEPEIMPAPQPKPQTTLVVPERPAPRLVSSNEPAVSLIAFATTALERHSSSKIEFGEFYLAYHAHARSIGGRPLSPTEAVEPINLLCAQCGIDIRKRGKDRYLCGVRLRPQLATIEAETA